MTALTQSPAWLALARHRAGDFAQAEQLYRTVLSHQPNNAGALHMLGLLSFQAGRWRRDLGEHAHPT